MQKNKIKDDLTDEEIKDIKKFYSSDEKGKTFSTVEEFLEDLKK